MIKIGDKIRFLNPGVYIEFQNYKKCYGIVTEVKDSGGVKALIRLNFGRKHKSFRKNLPFYIRKENFAKISWHKYRWPKKRKKEL